MRLALDELQEPLAEFSGTAAGPGQDVLKADQHQEGEHPFGERDILRQQHGRQSGAERHGDHEIENVHLRQRTLAGDPQQQNQCRVGQHTDHKRAPDPGPAIEEDRLAYATQSTPDPSCMSFACLEVGKEFGLSANGIDLPFDTRDSQGS